MQSETSRDVRRRLGSDLALLLAAERLFAERGLAGVSLREINQAANQKNISAAHYHFGSREGLVDAILRHRLPSLDRRRGLLAARDAPSKDLRFYIGAFIAPLIEEMEPREEGNHFIRFMQQYERSVLSYDVVRRLTPEASSIYLSVERLIGYLPVRIRRLRLRYLINIVHSVLASAEERLSAGELSFEEVPMTAANLVDMVVAALSAPLSPETIALLPDVTDGTDAVPA